MPVYIEQRDQRPEISHILHQDSGARLVEGLITHFSERHPKHHDVIARLQLVARPGSIIDESAIWGELY